ncbi:uroporphyrinogen-III C-methyltransferase [Gammaproteobacteria bacterium]|nr:uroporphyrinogen-III C-methyltransferase [Gammaproteobacteria bacterium]
MTDKENTPAQDKSEQPSAAITGALAAGEKTASASSATAASPARRSSSKAGGIFSLFLNIILLAAIGVLAYFMYEQDKAVKVLFEQQNSLSSQRNNTGAQVSQLQSSLQSLESQLQNQLAETQQASASLTRDLIQQSMQGQDADIERLQNELISTRLRINSNNPGASQQWLLAEAASLLRLAQQQMVVARNIRTAQALFIAADDVLKQIDDPAIFSVREVLAGELAAIRGVSEAPIQDIYLQLGAISEQLESLQVNNDLEQQVAEGERVALFNNERIEEPGLLSQFFSSLGSVVNRFLVVRRRDTPLGALMTPGQEAALLQTVRLQLEQGRIALLKGEQEIYSASLLQARNNIADYLSGEASLKTSILSSLDTLIRRRIVTEVPPLIRTRSALDQIILAGELVSERTQPLQ